MVKNSEDGFKGCDKTQPWRLREGMKLSRTFSSGEAEPARGSLGKQDKPRLSGPSGSWACPAPLVPSSFQSQLWASGPGVCLAVLILFALTTGILGSLLGTDH